MTDKSWISILQRRGRAFCVTKKYPHIFPIWTIRHWISIIRSSVNISNYLIWSNHLADWLLKKGLSIWQQKNAQVRPWIVIMFTCMGCCLTNYSQFNRQIDDPNITKLLGTLFHRRTSIFSSFVNISIISIPQRQTLLKWNIISFWRKSHECQKSVSISVNLAGFVL